MDPLPVLALAISIFIDLYERKRWSDKLTCIGSKNKRRNLNGKRLNRKKRKRSGKWGRTKGRRETNKIRCERSDLESNRKRVKIKIKIRKMIKVVKIQKKVRTKRRSKKLNKKFSHQRILRVDETELQSQKSKRRNQNYLKRTTMRRMKRSLKPMLLIKKRSPNQPFKDSCSKDRKLRSLKKKNKTFMTLRTQTIVF